VLGFLLFKAFPTFMAIDPAERARINAENGKLGGRPKGALSKRTLNKMKVQKRIEQRYMRVADAIATAQIHIATGQTFLYKIEKEWIKTGVNKKTGEENGYWRSKKPVQVESQFEIETYLERLVDEENGEAEPYEEGETYFFITAKEPNNEALKDIQNRIFGKPKETLDVNATHTFSLKGLAKRREAVKQLPKGQYRVIDAPAASSAAPEVPIQATTDGPIVSRRNKL
jgi:hypothetical protein